MKSCIILSVVCLHLGWIYGETAGAGVASYAYQDSSGKRYGGTFDLDNGQLYPSKGIPNSPRDWDNYANAQVFTSDEDFGGGWGNFAPFQQPFRQYDDFIPEYFSNLQNLLNEAFNSNVENQKLAYDAARKAFDLTSNRAGYNSYFPSRFSNFDGYTMPNSAFAGAAAGPGFSHQIAALNPANPTQPNVDIKNRFSDTAGDGGKFYGVSSSSYSSSSNQNGKQVNFRGAETTVNNNGVVTRYRVQS